MAQDINTASRRIPRWIKIALGLSLAVNLAVVGVVAGAAFRGPPKDPRPGVSGYATAYIKALPREDRHAILQKVRKSGGQGRLSGDERRALFDEMLAALRAQELDRAVITDVLNKQKAASLGVQSGVQDQWIALVAGMSKDERLIYADAVQEVLDRKRERRNARKP
jgi:uncharacterized membrane protein